MGKKILKVIAGTPDRPLIIGDIQIPCYVLEDETRVLSQRGLQTGIGMSGSGPAKPGERRIAVFLASLAKKGIEIKELTARIQCPIEFTPTGGGRSAFGYEATILADICDIVFFANKACVLQPNQSHIAEKCQLLMRGFARIGIIGLVDEATGYQRLREERALATILEKFIDKEFQPWTKTFPYEFYEQIFRLKGWPGPEGVKRPSVIGHYTNDFIYSRLAPGVLDELKKINPKQAIGDRRHRHHQWFTPDIGHPRLKEHLAAVIALMRAAPNWDSFQRSLQRALPKLNETIPLL